jgi:hypothetical protein
MPLTLENFVAYLRSVQEHGYKLYIQPWVLEPDSNRIAEDMLVGDEDLSSILNGEDNKHYQIPATMLLHVLFIIEANQRIELTHRKLAEVRRWTEDMHTDLARRFFPRPRLFLWAQWNMRRRAVDVIRGVNFRLTELQKLLLNKTQ